MERNYLVDPPKQIVNVPDWKRASVIVEYYKSRHYTLHWSRNNHAVFGTTCNAVLFTAIATGNRLMARQHHAQHHQAQEHSWVRLLPPELWDCIFRFLTGASFPGTYSAAEQRKHAGNPVGLAAQQAVSRGLAGATPAKSPWMKNFAWM